MIFYCRTYEIALSYLSEKSSNLMETFLHTVRYGSIHPYHVIKNEDVQSTRYVVRLVSSLSLTQISIENN